MSVAFIRTPFAQEVQAGIRSHIADAMQIAGKSLACHVVRAVGPMITVAFDVTSLYTLPQITIPVFGPEYVRWPLQPGDRGYCVAVDQPVGFTSGQTSTPADLSDPGNLEALFFMPIGNTGWQVVDGQSVVVYAPNGVTLRDSASGAVIVLHPTTITATIGSTSVTMDASTITLAAPSTITLQAPNIVLDGELTQGTEAGGYPATLQGPVTVVHEVTANGIPLSTHLHADAGGSGDSGPPIP